MNNRWLHRSIQIICEADKRRTGNSRILLLISMMLGWLMMILAVPGTVTPVWGADMTPVPSYGKGPKELIVFSDYFCPPCMTLEADLEPALEKILARGDVKVTFIDIPGHPPTAMYAKYFLFSTQGTPGYQNVMHARNVLFALSKQNLAKTEAEIEAAFTAQGVSFKPLNPKPIYTEWNRIIKLYRITTTPTCILKYSEKDIRKYQGSVEIRNGLLPELEAMGKKKKP